MEMTQKNGKVFWGEERKSGISRCSQTFSGAPAEGKIRESPQVGAGKVLNGYYENFHHGKGGQELAQTAQGSGRVKSLQVLKKNVWIGHFRTWFSGHHGWT